MAKFRFTVPEVKLRWFTMILFTKFNDPLPLLFTPNVLVVLLIKLPPIKIELCHKVVLSELIISTPLIAAGADGVISVVANAFPAKFSEMVRASLQGDLVKARKLHYDLLKVTQLFFADGNPGGVKVALETQKLCPAYLRLPLYPVNESIAKSIKAETKKLAR